MRHKIKRLWAEAARTLPPQSLDLTILPSPESASLGLSEIRAELKKILR
jgi:RNase P protein component